MSLVIYDSENRITNPYSKGYHNGVDLGYRTNEEMNKVYSNSYGEVVEVQRNQPQEPGSKKWGNYVLIKHPNGWYSRYCHLQNNILVNVGDIVDENTQIGIEGTSGDAEYRHLHFEVSTAYSTTTRIDPTPYLTNKIAERPGKVKYKAHVQGVGWQTFVSDGETAGTTGRWLRMEAIIILSDIKITAKAHLQDIGWVDYGEVNGGKIIGTEGESRRLEALCLKGDIKYRLHISTVGWTSWTNADGIITLGSVGQSLQVEAIEIKPL